MTKEEISAATTDQLRKRWNSLCNWHDSMVDNCEPMGSDNIYNASNEMNVIEKELKERNESLFID